MKIGTVPFSHFGEHSGRIKVKFFKTADIECIYITDGMENDGGRDNMKNMQSKVTVLIFVSKKIGTVPFGLFLTIR
jgi:hypothetical protein